MKSYSIPIPTRQTMHHVSRGFSLVEIMIVLALVGMIAALVIQNIGPITENAKIKAAKTYVSSTLKTPISSFYLDVGKPPSQLRDLVVNPGLGTRWKGPYVDTAKFEDPWGNEYQYRIPPEKSISNFDVWSKGPDGNSGTSDDVGNWSS